MAHAMTVREITRASTKALHIRLAQVRRELEDEARPQSVIEAMEREESQIEKELDAREEDAHFPIDYDATDRLAFQSECYSNLFAER